MVCLNENITFNKLKLKNNLIKEITNEFDSNFYFQGLEIDEKTKSEITFHNVNNIKEIIRKSIKKLFENDNFIYINMDDNLCVHKFKKGKRDGYFCCKKITKNGDKKQYVCTMHNKNHVPSKRNKNSKNSKIFENSRNINETIIKLHNKKIIKRKMKLKNKKIKINVYGEINFNNIIKRLSQEIYNEFP